MVSRQVIDAESSRTMRMEETPMYYVTGRSAATFKRAPPVERQEENQKSSRGLQIQMLIRTREVTEVSKETVMIW